MFEVERKGAVTVVSLDRPPVNAMNDEWVDRLNAILDAILADGDCNVVLFRSRLKLFSAGADLAQLRARQGQPSDLQADVGRRYQNLFARIEGLPKATIAEIGGGAYGGGLELALACDFRFAAIDTKLALPEIGLGLIPGAGGTQRLTQLCGRAQALRLILGAETIDGQEAARIGLVHESFSQDSLGLSVMARAERLAALPAHAIASAKICIAAAVPALQSGFNQEIEQVRRLLADPRTDARIRAFLDK